MADPDEAVCWQSGAPLKFPSQGVPSSNALVLRACGALASFAAADPSNTARSSASARPAGRRFRRQHRLTLPGQLFQLDRRPGDATRGRVGRHRGAATPGCRPRAAHDRPWSRRAFCRTGVSSGRRPDAGTRSLPPRMPRASTRRRPKGRRCRRKDDNSSGNDGHGNDGHDNADELPGPHPRSPLLCPRYLGCESRREWDMNPFRNGSFGGRPEAEETGG